MAVEKLIKRTVWEGHCLVCGNDTLEESEPPKAKLCKCGKGWLSFKETSVIGPDLGLKAYQ
jgi:hypothetical protein